MASDKIYSFFENSINTTNKLISKTRYFSLFYNLHQKKIDSILFFFWMISFGITFLIFSLNEETSSIRILCGIICLAFFLLLIPTIGRILFLIKPTKATNVKSYILKVKDHKINKEERPYFPTTGTKIISKQTTKKIDTEILNSFDKLISNLEKLDFYDSDNKNFVLSTNYELTTLQSFQILLLYFTNEYNLNHDIRRQDIYDLFNDYFNLEEKKMTSKNWKDYSKYISKEDSNEPRHSDKYNFYYDLPKLE